MADEPSFNVRRLGTSVRVSLAGGWIVRNGRQLERLGADLAKECGDAREIVFDLAGVTAFDTAGAWMIGRSRAGLEQGGAAVSIENATNAHQILLQEASHQNFERPVVKQGFFIVDMLADLGFVMVMALKDLWSGVAFFGEVMSALVRLVLRPARFRFTSVVFHIENFAFRSLPIIALINFLVGGIVAQQGIFQLSRFGASTFTVDLIGILVLRELAVLLTSIMVAGRTGSAITAELGSMKMREEIDALRVMGLDPIDVLVIPRLLALLVSLPLLTFLADLSAIFGGLVVAWQYGGISPDVFMSRLQAAIAMNTFMVGIIKAPVMALLIGMIAAIEGFRVQGSAESLGRQVTASVVKSIFMVIVVDGIFAIFFAAINY